MKPCFLATVGLSFALMVEVVAWSMPYSLWVEKLKSRVCSMEVETVSNTPLADYDRTEDAEADSNQGHCSLDSAHSVLCLFPPSLDLSKLVLTSDTRFLESVPVFLAGSHGMRL